jgi:hypothetical protein
VAATYNVVFWGIQMQATDNDPLMETASGKAPLLIKPFVPEESEQNHIRG